MSSTPTPHLNENLPDRSTESIGTVGFTIQYPILPDNLDFETFRKTDPHYKLILDKFSPLVKTAGILDNEKVDSAKKRERTRYIMQMWPRDPKGEGLGEMPDGKMTSNGLPLWGATIYDFYFVHKFPDIKGMLTFMSGSKMAKWARQKGELYAMDYIKQAEEEESEPKIMHPYHIGEFIELVEQQVHLKNTGRSLKVDKTSNEKVPNCLLPPSEYPGRWPLAPFSTPTCRLQERIPHKDLPKKLIVHDPWGCLSGESRSEHSGEKWSTKRDIVYTYRLTRCGPRKGTTVVDETPSSHAISEAHIFITPKRRIGTGHHSFIYQAELELPRELVVKPKQCVTCSSEGEPIASEEDPYRKRELFEMKDQHAPYCEHLDDGVPRPKTARVSVTAKLTMPDDRHEENHTEHLRNEAWNYMNFPDHMFEHWNGYNIIRPCQDPLPVGAVVPQFYGYYVPDASHKVDEDDFLSPILLLEHCGVQANMKSLTLEERRECWSLLERLHLAGYVHNSVYERNILIQNGPVQWSPFKRSKMHPRFRLIDFGRCEENSDKGLGTYSEFDKADREFRLDFLHNKDHQYV